MDTLDRRIVNELQKDASQTMETLAAAVASTPATCHRRMQKLTRDGTLKKVVSIADAAISNEPLTVILGIVLSSQTPTEQRQVKKILTAFHETKFVWMTTGDFDYIFMATFRDANALRTFVEVDLMAIPNIRNFRSFLAIDEIKFDTFRDFE